MNTEIQHRQRSAGFTMIEVLVAVVVLGIGVLGVAALQTKSLQQGQGSLQATQALALAYDYADRMRANAAAAYQGEYDNAPLTTPSPQTCPNGGNCTSTTLASADKYAWYQLVKSTLPLGSTVRVYCSDGSDCSTTGTLGAPQTINVVVYWNQERNTNATTVTSSMLHCGYDPTNYDPVNNNDLPCVTLSLQP